jgi:hypothetical protein
MVKTSLILIRQSILLAVLAVSSTATHAIYWNVFNIEEETSFGAGFVTYNSVTDMLLDQNRVGVFSPDGLGSSENNIVGSGSDGTTYWNVFNIEEETSFGAGFVTYNSLLDMLLDQNRAGVFSPDGLGSSENNIVGSGAFVAGPSMVPEPSAILLFGVGIIIVFASQSLHRRQRRLV